MKIRVISMAEYEKELILPVINRKYRLIDESSAISICLANARRIFHCYIGAVGYFDLAKSNIKRFTEVFPVAEAITKVASYLCHAKIMPSNRKRKEKRNRKSNAMEKKFLEEREQ